MKFNGTLLAICVFHPVVWRSSAFVVQVPNARTNALSPSFSFVPGINEGVGVMNEASREVSVNVGRHRQQYQSCKCEQWSNDMKTQDTLLCTKSKLSLFNSFSKDSSLPIPNNNTGHLGFPPCFPWTRAGICH